MPAPATTTSCGWCGGEFPKEEPVRYRLASSGACYSWVSEAGVLAEARCSAAGLWEVLDAAGGETAVTLLAGAAGEDMRVTLLDRHVRPLAIVVVAGGERLRGSGAYRRRLGTILSRGDVQALAVYGDGPTGIHLVNHEHAVVVLASSVRGSGAVDVLVTASSPTPNPITLCAVMLALELVRSGQLSPSSESGEGRLS